MKYAITLKQLREHGACYSGYNQVVRMLQGKEFTKADAERETYIRFVHKDKISLIDIANNSGIIDAIWCLRCAPDCDRDARLYAVWCSRQVQHLMTDKRSLNALDVAEAFANGKAGEQELYVAFDAAWEAALADVADESAACSAFAASAWYSVEAVAVATASVAASAAARAAWAARDAARASLATAEIAQKEMFIMMCTGDAPWQKEEV
jgi:hypothetical protein